LTSRAVHRAADRLQRKTPRPRQGHPARAAHRRGQLSTSVYWELSILRLNQLDYFDKIEADKAAELKKNTKDGTVDITLSSKGEGQAVHRVQGGVELAGRQFPRLTYQTNNFWDWAKHLRFRRSSRFDAQLHVRFTEPYLFDGDLHGFHVFSSRYKFDQHAAALFTAKSVSIQSPIIQNYIRTARASPFMRAIPSQIVVYTSCRQLRPDPQRTLRVSMMLPNYCSPIAIPQHRRPTR